MTSNNSLHLVEQRKRVETCSLLLNKLIQDVRDLGKNAEALCTLQITEAHALSLFRELKQAREAEELKRADEVRRQFEERTLFSEVGR
jgi:cysteinyl-tRNA synthetase